MIKLNKKGFIMKRLLLPLIVALMLLPSCKDNDVDIENNINENEIIEPTPSDENDIEVIPEIKKPETIEEIIALADELNVDTSLNAFSLEGVLEEAQLQPTEDAGDDYQNSTAYLGDSVTMGLAFFDQHPSEMVIAKGSINPLDAVDKKLIESSDGTMINFVDALKNTGAERAVLTFGSNAISVMNEETFLKYYIKLIDAIQAEYPECEIIIQSITPLATTCTLKKLTNPLVNRSNLLLLSLCYSKDLKFLNSTKNMKDEQGYLKLEYCSSSDGIHINESGYQIWINMLRTHKLEK